MRRCVLQRVPVSVQAEIELCHGNVFIKDNAVLIFVIANKTKNALRP